MGRHTPSKIKGHYTIRTRNVGMTSSIRAEAGKGGGITGANTHECG
jgi:hypothetical protein